MDAGSTACGPLAGNSLLSDRDLPRIAAPQQRRINQMGTIESHHRLLCALPTVCWSALRTETQVWLPRVTAGRGAAVTLPAKRGTIRFAVAAGVFFGHDELWSSSIVMSLTE
jgi:hypothetical protein